MVSLVMTHDVSEAYLELAPTYNERLASCHYITPNFVAYCLKGLTFEGKPTILDLGAGTGLVGVRAEELELDADFVAFDLSPAMLAQIPPRSLYTERRDGSIDEPLPFADENFDAVVSAGLLEYVKCPRKYLDEVDRVLRKGGFVVFSYAPSSTEERETFDVGHEVFSHPQVAILDYVFEKAYGMLGHTHFDAYVNNGTAVVHHLLVAQKPF